MTNLFYNPSGNPGIGADGASALMRAEFLAISTGFSLLPPITTTGAYATVFNQAGNYTYTLPPASDILAGLSDVAMETTRANQALNTETNARMVADVAVSAAAETGRINEVNRAYTAEGVISGAVTTETFRAMSAEAAEIAARNTAIGVETTRALAAEAVALGGIGRNRLHNGGFGINQRAYVSGTALAAAAYAHDRWKAGAGGCTYTFTQTQPTTAITVTAGTLQQVVEALTVEGGAYMLSWIGTATARINAGSYLASPIPVTGFGGNTAITVEFNTGTVDRAQLEPGSTATVFARRSYRYELAECQRFYETGTTDARVYCNSVSLSLALFIPLTVTKRAAPSITYSGTTYVNASAIAADTQSLGGFRMTYTCGTTNPVAELSTVWQASADL